MHRLVPAAALATALVLAAAGCTGSEPGAEPDPSPGDESTSQGEPSEPTPSDAETSGSDGALEWEPVPGSIDAVATVSGPWTLVVAPGGGGAALTGPRRQSIRVPAGYRVTDALIDGQRAVVAAGDKLAEKPDVARVVDLDTGDVSTIDGDSDVPTTVGGPWALGSGLLVHATDEGSDYCLAVVDLRRGRSDRGPCVGPREGLTNVRVSPAGITAQTFDDARPVSCRTLNRVEDEQFVPLRGVEECRGWEGVTTETSAVWGVVTKERLAEQSQFFADSGNGRVNLGRGLSGTLTWCGDAAYFARDPQRDSDPARLLRVEPDGTSTVVYESPGRGKALLEPPRCGGTDLTITALTSAGDEQVTASLE